MTKYYYLILTQEEFFKNQVVEEVLRERITYLLNEQKSIDFWITPSPLFFENTELKKELIKTQFYEQNQNVLINKDCYLIMLISTNYEYFKWLKLRLGYFEDFYLKNNKLKNNQKFKSDGLCGILEIEKFDIKQLFQSKESAIHPKIRMEKLNEAFAF